MKRKNIKKKVRWRDDKALKVIWEEESHYLKFVEMAYSHFMIAKSLLYEVWRIQDIPVIKKVDEPGGVYATPYGARKYPTREDSLKNAASRFWALGFENTLKAKILADGKEYVELSPIGDGSEGKFDYPWKNAGHDLRKLFGLAGLKVPEGKELALVTISGYIPTKKIA